MVCCNLLKFAASGSGPLHVDIFTTEMPQTLQDLFYHNSVSSPLQCLQWSNTEATSVHAKAGVRIFAPNLRTPSQDRGRTVCSCAKRRRLPVASAAHDWLLPRAARRERMAESKLREHLRKAGTHALHNLPKIEGEGGRNCLSPSQSG